LGIGNRGSVKSGAIIIRLSACITEMIEARDAGMCGCWCWKPYIDQ